MLSPESTLEPICFTPFLGIFLELLFILAVILYIISFFVDKKLKEKLKKGAIILLVVALLGSVIYIFLPSVLKLYGIQIVNCGLPSI